MSVFFPSEYVTKAIGFKLPLTPIFNNESVVKKLKKMDEPFYRTLGFQDNTFIHKDWCYECTLSIHDDHIYFFIKSFIDNKEFNDIMQNVFSSPDKEFDLYLKDHLTNMFISGGIKSIFDILSDWNKYKDTTTLIKTIISAGSEVDFTPVESEDGNPLHFDEQVRLKEALKELDEIDDEISKIHAKRASALFDTTTYFKVLTNTEVSAKTKSEVIKTIVEFYGDPSLVIDCKDNGEPYSVSPEGKEIPMGLDPILEEQIKEIILKDGE